MLSTAAQIDRGGKIKGSGVLAKAIGANGHKVIARIREWLGVDDFTRNDKGAILTNSQGNIRLALSKLGIVVEFDRFSERIFFETPTTSRRLWTEEALIKTRFQIDMEFRFLPAEGVPERRRQKRRVGQQPAPGPRVPRVTHVGRHAPARYVADDPRQRD